MAEAIPMSTIGVKVSYCIETTAGTRPTTGYTHIKGIKSTPDMNVAPSTADTTTFDNLEYTTHIDLLKEMPDTLEFNAQFSQELYNTWTTMVTNSKQSSVSTSTGAGKRTWFCIDIPGFDKSIYFTGVPSNMGMPAMEANSAVEVTLYIVPTSEPVFEADPEYVQ